MNEVSINHHAAMMIHRKTCCVLIYIDWSDVWLWGTKLSCRLHKRCDVIKQSHDSRTC